MHMHTCSIRTLIHNTPAHGTLGLRDESLEAMWIGNHFEYLEGRVLGSGIVKE